MREIVHIQAGQCGNQIGAKVSPRNSKIFEIIESVEIERFFVCGVIVGGFHSFRVCC